MASSKSQEDNHNQDDAAAAAVEQGGHIRDDGNNDATTAATDVGVADQKKNKNNKADPTTTAQALVREKKDQEEEGQEAATAAANNKNNNNKNDNNKTDTKSNEEVTPQHAKRKIRQKQLSTDNLNWGIPANHQATQHAQDVSGDTSWEFQLLKVLHGRRVQIFLAALLFLDVLILFCELALLTLYPSCHLVERDAISCCPIMNGVDENANQTTTNGRMLAGGGEEGDDDDHHHNYCADASLQAMPSYEATCDEHKWSRVHHAETALVSLTLTILAVFFIELTLTMIALKPNVFFRQVFYTMDYIIVTVSLALEITFFTLDDQVLTSLVGLVILGRIWRFVRIGHGILELAEDMAHERETALLVYAEELEELLASHKIPLPVGELKPLEHGHGDGSGCDVLERLAKRHRDKRRMQYHQSVSGSS